MSELILGLAEEETITLEQEVNSHVYTIFQNVPLLFHNIQHTEQVVSSVEKLAQKLELPSNEKLQLKIAAWFHDVGIVHNYKAHEPESVAMMRLFFADRLYYKLDLGLIENCILATKMPQSPDTLMEQIICDADLSHLGEANYFEWLTRLRSEWETVCGKVFSDDEWIRLNIQFLTQHHYHTTAAQEMFGLGKELNIRKLKGA